MSKLKCLVIAAALVVGGTCMAGTSMALAQNGPATGGEPPIAGGAAGNAAAPGPGNFPAATSTQYAPGHYYDHYQGQGSATGNTTWCENHYRSYNPATGMYRGFDGRMHPCP